MSGEEQTVYGIKAVLALFEHRPEDLLRIYYRADRLDALRPLLKWAAGNRLPYREQDDAALRRVAGGPHHEGVAAAARPLRVRPFTPELVGSGHCWLALDEVSNPHNLGAILRSAAFFGLAGVLLGGTAAGAKVNAAAIRVSEGGAERLVLCGAEHLPRALETLAERGVAVVGLEADAPRPLEAAPGRTPWVLVAGHEQEGLTPAVRAACTGVYAIQGAGGVGSLNVSVAVGVALQHLVERPAASAPPPAAPEEAFGLRRGGRPPSRR